MVDSTVPIAVEDAAWVSFKTPLDKAEMVSFCQDVGRLLRINPYLEFRNWVDCGDNRYRFKGRNISLQPAAEIELEMEVEPQSDGVYIRYSDGLKSTTQVKVEAAPEGSQVTIVEDYGGVDESEREARIDEVDRSLVKWAEDLQLYLIRWQRWSWLSPWRWYMQRIWEPMKPAARRITYMLLWISLAEVALILLGVGIYFAEYR
ncbi:MAG: hypothetical protein ABW120_14530 [Sedimenticola sp.]